MDLHEEVRADRDALAFLGLLARAYLTWDPPVPAGLDQHGVLDFTHFHGLNIHAVVIDNHDGEVLALAQNGIHKEESPLAHAEQRAIRAAMSRLAAKHPRQSGTTVENWYRGELFYEQGAAPGDFIHKGATLVTSLEPCPYCAAALCVARMKRVVFLIEDQKFGGGWPMVKARFYDKYEFQYSAVQVTGLSGVCSKAGVIQDDLAASIRELRTQNVQDSWFLDRLHDHLASALIALAALSTNDFAEGASREINRRTLEDFRRICKLPMAA